MTLLTETFAHRAYNSIFRQQGGDWRPAETHLHWLTKLPDSTGPEVRTTAVPSMRIDHHATERNFFATAATTDTISNTALIRATATAAVQDIVGIGLYEEAAATTLLMPVPFDDGEPRDLAEDDVIEFQPGELTIRFPALTNPPQGAFALNAFSSRFLNGWLRRDAVTFPTTWHVGLLSAMPTTRTGTGLNEADFTPRAPLPAASLGAPANKVGTNTAIIRHAAATGDEPDLLRATALYDAATGGTPYMAGVFLPPGFTLDVNDTDQAQVDIGRLNLGIL